MSVGSEIAERGGTARPVNAPQSFLGVMGTESHPDPRSLLSVLASIPQLQRSNLSCASNDRSQSGELHTARAGRRRYLHGVWVNVIRVLQRPLRARHSSGIAAPGRRGQLSDAHLFRLTHKLGEDKREASQHDKDDDQACYRQCVGLIWLVRP
jgi:hypothetical protein